MHGVCSSQGVAGLGNASDARAGCLQFKAAFADLKMASDASAALAVQKVLLVLSVPATPVHGDRSSKCVAGIELDSGASAFCMQLKNCWSCASQ